MRNAYKILVEKPEEKRQLRRPRSRWEDNIRLDLIDVVLEGVNWIHLALNRDQFWAVVNAVMNLQIL
jgi:hypothetical protein